MAPGVIEVGPASGPHTDLQAETNSKPPSPRSQPDHEEYQYLDLIRDIIDNGEHRPDRTGTGTYSIFAPRPMKYSLSRPSNPSSSSTTSTTSTTSTSTSSTTTPTAPADPTPILPLLTTKRVFLRAVIAELLWFLTGSTTSHPLSAQGIKIWDGNGSRPYLDSIGLTDREEGDLGPVYGFQWRHFGAEYRTAKDDYNGEGVDQLKEVVRKLRECPWDRRIVLSAWNPADLRKMALPPCHMFAQFYVSFEGKGNGDRRKRRGEEAVGGGGGGGGGGGLQQEDGEATTTTRGDMGNKEKGTLHCQLYQRSCDMGLGIPFNIASYALLTHMLAYVCDLTPGSLTHVMGDAHVYVDHVSALEEQLKREPREFPELELRPRRGEGEEAEVRPRGGGAVEGMEGWRVEDFVVKGYRPHGKIEMKMSV